MVPPASVSATPDKLLPDLVQTTEAESAAKLFDRDATTLFSAFGRTTVTLSLGASREVNALRLFGKAPYRLTVKTSGNGLLGTGLLAGAKTVPGFEAVDLSVLGAGWNTLAFPEVVAATELQLVLDPLPQGGTGLAEVELWAKGQHVNAPTASLLSADGQAPAAPQVLIFPASEDQRSEGTAVGGGATPETANFEIALPVNPAALARAALVYEVQGVSHWSEVRRTLNGQVPQGGYVHQANEAWSRQEEPIAPASLIRGKNSIALQAGGDGASGIRVRNVRLVVEPFDGWNFAAKTIANQGDATALLDGQTQAGWAVYPANVADRSAEPAYVGAEFRQSMALDRVRFHLRGSVTGELAVDLLVGGTWQPIRETLAAGSLTEGWNTIELNGREAIAARLRFTGGDGPGEITEVELVGSPAATPSANPQLAVTFPDAGQYYGDVAYVRGFLAPHENASGPAQIIVAGKPVDAVQGVFEASVSQSDLGVEPGAAGWSVDVEAVFPDGARVTRTVNFTSLVVASSSDRRDATTNAMIAEVAPGLAKTLAHLGAALEIGADALAKKTRIQIQPLRPVDMPSLEPGMVNVTKGASQGFRFLPHGQRFEKSVKVRLPFDAALLPEGKTAADIKTYYFDTSLGRWQALEKAEVDSAKNEIVSLTTHFTDMVNAVVQSPDSPETSSFNPTQIKDLKVADPGASVNLIEAPAANATGDVRLSYPIELPPGRTGLAPQLGLSYNSSGGNGWLGVGWNLPASAIMIDTRWGVPRYSAENETETYILDGEQLAPVAHRGELVPRTPEKTFRARVEGGFRRITRHGSSPANYWWEVREKDGTAYFYGGDPATGGPAVDSTLTDGSGNVYMWALREVRDTNGNTIHYRHTRGSDPGNGGASGSELYLEEIDYTGDEAGRGAYTVVLTRDRELNEPRRADVMIDARGGFKRVTADLLRKVEIRFQGQNVRSYELLYSTGAFDKTLLASVKQFDAAGAEFNKHEFTYFDEARASPTEYRGFIDRTNWNTGSDDVEANGLFGDLRASALSGNEGRGFGGHLYVGVGPRASKTNSVGVKFGGASSDSEGLLALIDINGDGLQDKVFREGREISYRRNRSGPNAGSTTTFGGKVTVGNLPAISRENSSNASAGPEAYLGASVLNGFVGLNLSSTDVESPVYFIDVNGDGLVDLVNGRTVLFNRVNANLDPVFTPDSSETPYPVGQGAVVAGMLTAELQAIAARENAMNPKIDTLRRWIAPFTGSITITAPVALVQDPAADDYDTEDGVRVAIQLNANELWSETIAPTDFAPKTPTGVAGLAVQKGDIVYFRVQSINDGAFDRVAWAPQIAYTAAPAVDADGLNPFAYDIAQDFTLLASRMALITAPLTGTVSVTGTLVKSAPTSDDATLELVKNGAVIAARPIPAAATGSFSFNESVSVQREIVDQNGNQTQDGDELSIRLRIDSRVDLTKFQWDTAAPPRITYTASPDLPEGAAFPAVDAISSASLYPESDLISPLAPWVAPSDGAFTFEAEVTGGMGPFTLTAKKPVTLLAKTAVTPGTPVQFTLNAVAGDTVFFEFHGASDAGVTARRVRLVSGGIAQDPDLPSALYFASADDILPQRHRGWNAFGYDGNMAAANQPVVLATSDLTLSALGDINRNDFRNTIEDAIRQGTDPSAAMMSRFQLKALPYWPDFVQARLEGPDPDLFASATDLSASRRGKNAVLDGTVDRFAGGRAVPRRSLTTQRGVAGGVGLGIGGLGVNGSISFAKSDGRALIEFKDLNGDLFPDVIGSGLSVQFSPAVGGLEGSSRNVGAGPFAQETDAETFSFGVGGNYGQAVANAKADFDARTGNPPSPNGDTGQLEVSVGITANISEGKSDVDYDLIDINGDGLPDKLRATGGQLRVQLNLGYTFAAEEPWDVGDVNKAESEAFTAGGTAGLSLGYNDGIYGFAGGINTSQHQSGSLFSLQDFNGDGLLDRVRVDGRTSSVVSVAMNDGNGFMAELPWPGANGAGLANTVQETHDAGLYFTISFCPTGVAFCIITNPGASFDRTMGRAESAVVDVDGDGYPDHVTSTRDSSMSVGRNPTDRTNLLRGVKRPLGASFEVSYDRAGNTYAMQPSRWVLSRLVMDDGQPGDGQDKMIRTYAWIDGVHERREREFYGFRQCVETHFDPALISDLNQPLPQTAAYRTITRTYLNDTYYVKGLLAREELADAAGAKYTQVENTYVVRDEATQTAITDPAALRDFTAAAFPQLARTDKRWFERQAVAGKTTFETFVYDIYGNVTAYLDGSDEGPGDDMTATIAYHVDLPPYIVGKANRIVVNGDGRELRRRTATFEPGTGNLLQVKKALADGSEAISDMTYDGFGNILTMTGPTNHRGQRYAMTYTYDPTVVTHVASVTDSFGYVSRAEYDLRWGLMSLNQDINNQRITTTYDAKGRMADLVGPYQQGTALKTIIMEYHPEAQIPWARTRHVDPDRSATDFIETATFIDGLKRVTQTKKDLALHTSNGNITDTMMISGRVRYDGFGRAIEQFYPLTQPVGTAGTFAPAYDTVQPTRTTYDVPDRAESVANPANETTRFRYDFGPDRDGRQQFRTTVTDPNGVRREVYRDVDDDIATVNLFNTGGSTVQRTSYQYNAIDEITAVIDDRNNVTRAEYDNFGRRTAIDSPDMGRTRFVFDLASNLRNRETAVLRGRGQAITYGYDFNRLATIAYPVFPQNNVTYTYGAPAAPNNAANRVTRVVDATGTTDRRYGPLGEVTRETKTIPVTGSTVPLVATTQWRFDTWNRLQQMTYPDGEVLTNVYDSGGLVRQVRGRKGSFTYEYVRALAYDKFEARAFLRSGNNAVSTYAYNPLHRRMANLNSRLPAGYRFQNLNYSYDKVGNVTALNNDILRTGGQSGLGNEVGGPSTQTFAYDDLYQLTRAEGHYRRTSDKDDRYILNMSYDTIHNITRKTQDHAVLDSGGGRNQYVGTTYDFTYRYESPKPHAASVIGPFDLGYDANGNLIRKFERATQHTFQNIWDEENRLACHHEDVARPLAQDPTSCDERDEDPKVRFTYDATGNRVIKDSDTQRFYVNQWFTARGSDRHKHVFVGASRMVTKFSKPDNGFEDIQYFFHPDHLGSTSLLTDRLGFLAEHISYFPFGETWVQEHKVQPIAYQFSGKELDDETKLYYFGARYYDPRTSVWQSADPILEGYLDTSKSDFRAPALVVDWRAELSGPGMGGMFQPKNVNLYGYTHQNPVRITDPDGRAAQACAVPPITAACVAVADAAVKAVVVVGSAALAAIGITWAMGDSGDDAAPAQASRPDLSGTPATPPDGFDPNGLGPAPQTPRGKGVSTEGHTANVTVRDAQGKIVTRTRFASQPQTASESALGFPRSSNAAHTEMRAMRTVELPRGGTMRITGKLPPCTQCRGAMDTVARNSQGRVTYQWRENGATQRWIRDYRVQQ